jgi:hypothetical protein
MESRKLDKDGINGKDSTGDGTTRSKSMSKNDEMIARAEKFLQQIEKYEPLDRETFGKCFATLQCL